MTIDTAGQLPPRPPLQPFRYSAAGWSPRDDPHSGDAEDWPNTVAVEAVERCAAELLEGDVGDDVGDGYADFGDVRHLVQVDTNYKDTRAGQHPVDLTRVGAVHLAAALLEATEDTFHFGRVGGLRAVEAAELLGALELVDAALANLRSHALQELRNCTGTAEQ